MPGPCRCIHAVWGMDIAMPKLIKNKKGFTLIEIIISIAILAIIITPLTSVFTGTFKMNTNTRENMEANHLAQKYMEYWKANPLDSFAEMTENGKTYKFKDVTENGYAIRTMVQVFSPPPAESPSVSPSVSATPADYTMPTGGNPTDFDITVDITSTQISILANSSAIISRNEITDSGDYPSGTYRDDNTDNIEIKLYENGADFSYYKLGTLTPSPSFLKVTQSIVFTHNSGGPVKIKILLNDTYETDQTRTVNFNVYNQLSALSADAAANIYIMHTATGEGNAFVKTSQGLVSVFSNIYDASVDNDYDKNRLYRIYIRVSKGTVYNDAQRLVELEGSKRME